MKLKREEALEILELEVDGGFPTETELKKQYRLLAMKWHPDKNRGNEDEAKVAFQRVHAAYQLLLKGEDYESDEEEIDDMDFEEAFSCFMETLREMHEMGLPSGIFISIGGDSFMGAGPGPDFMGRGGGGRGIPGFGPQRGRGRPAFFEEVSDDEDDYYDSDEDDEEDDGGEYQYYRAQQQRERARQEAQERERQQRAEELRAKQQERQKLTEEERRKNEERLEAEAKARALAQETEMLRKLISQLPRPTMAERTETSITLSMARLAKATGDNQLPKGCRWEMEMRAQSEPTWHCIHSSSSTSAVTAKDLIPGTKYVFRARGGRKMSEGGMEWGKYSEESFYATMGRQPAPSAQPSGQQSADSGQPGQSKKGRRREAAASKKEQPQLQKSGEVDIDEAKRRLKAEKEKEAAVKAAMERAAADYHRETEQLAAQKAETEAKLAEKVRRSRMKARRKEEAHEPAPKEEEAASQPPPPPPPPQAPKPPERELNDYADAFGSVRRIDAHPTGNGVANGGWYAPEDEELSLEEAIQLSLALEESERYAKEEAAMRSKLQYNETSFPSLGGGGSSNDDWGTFDEVEPQPPAKLGPVNHTSVPAAPPKLAPPPATPYRESERVQPTPQPSPGGYYPSGNARMAPPQVPPVKVSPPAAVPTVPRSMASPAPQLSPRGYDQFSNVRMAPPQVPPVKAPPAAVPRVPPFPRNTAPPPPLQQPYGKPTMMANGQGVFTEDDVIRQSRGPPGMHTNGVHHAGAGSKEVPLQRPGAAVPQRSAMPNGHASSRPRYNPLNPGPSHRPNGPPNGYAPPPVSARAASTSAEPMAALFPHLFPNSAA